MLNSSLSGGRLIYDAYGAGLTSISTYLVEGTIFVAIVVYSKVAPALLGFIEQVSKSPRGDSAIGNPDNIGSIAFEVVEPPPLFIPGLLGGHIFSNS